MVKKGLGRGLSSLISVYDDYSEAKEQKIEINNKSTQNNGVVELKLTEIYANPNQPRKNFGEDALNELSASIKIHGVVQPIIVVKKDNGYMIIAGERRWRASKIAGKEFIPALIKNYSDKEIKEISLIENLQREDLNPIETARAIKDLMTEYGWTHEAVADRLGKSRPNVTNILRLLNLTPEVSKLIEDGKLSGVHGRSLVVITDPKKQLQLALTVIEKQISTRELERIIKNLQNPAPAKEKKEQSIELKAFVEDMQRTFSTKVSLVGNEEKGRISIDYFTRDDLERIFELIESIKTNKK